VVTVLIRLLVAVVVVHREALTVLQEVQAEALVQHDLLVQGLVVQDQEIQDREAQEDKI